MAVCGAHQSGGVTPDDVTAANSSQSMSVPVKEGFRPAHITLSCWICGSGSAWESWWVAAEGEQCEGDEGLGAVEPERDSGE